MILGIGPVVAAPLLVFLSRVLRTDQGTLDYSALWLTLSAIGLLTTLVFAALFRDEAPAAREEALQ